MNNPSEKDIAMANLSMASPSPITTSNRYAVLGMEQVGEPVTLEQAAHQAAQNEELLARQEQARLYQEHQRQQQQQHEHHREDDNPNYSPNSLWLERTIA